MDTNELLGRMDERLIALDKKLGHFEDDVEEKLNNHNKGVTDKLNKIYKKLETMDARVGANTEFRQRWKGVVAGASAVAGMIGALVIYILQKIGGK